MGKYVKSVKDPIHGYIELTRLELEIVDTLPLQRLRRIKQLPGSEYVYPGAMNTRFEHSLGVMHLAGLMGKRISEQSGDDDIVRVLRVSGLLHDIGHGPFSHSFEPILRKSLGMSHEEMSVHLIERTEISDILGKWSIEVSEVADLIKGTHPRRSLSRIINSSVDADKMDYTVRDSYHTGAGYSVDIHRIALNSLEVNGDLVINARALEAVESLLMARLLSFRTVYYHKTSRAVQLMLETAMLSVMDRLDLPGCLKDPEIYLYLDDYTMWGILKEDERSREMMDRLMKRYILKLAREWYDASLTGEEVSELRSSIAKRAGLKEEDVVVDSPRIEFIKSTELPLLWRDGSLVDPLEASPVLSRLRNLLPRMVRVYTWPPYRDEVRRILRDRRPEDLL